MFKNKRRKGIDYSVKWTHWDNNRECLKIDKVGKP